MKRKALLNKLLFLLVICCIIGCDQYSKSIIRRELTSYDQIKLFYNSLTISKVENTGAFLSYGESLPEGVKFIFLSLLPIIILVFGVYYLMRLRNPGMLYAIGLCFVIGGGIGNLYDRMLYASVTDFMHLDFGFFATGVFNMADVSIMVGTVMLFMQVYRKKNEPQMIKSTPEESVDHV
jgi:signal peptidase II